MEIENLSKRYGETAVLENLSLTLPGRGVVAFTGPSGCGKTTLLRLIAGLEKPDGGEIRRPPGARVSMVFQEDRLLPSLSALDNILAVLPGRSAENHRLALHCLQCLGLAEAASLYPAQLSGGMKRRVAMARAVAHGGDILLLDEPFKGLDGENKRAAMDLVFRDAAGRLTVFVTHDPGEIPRADTVLDFRGPPLRLS